MSPLSARLATLATCLPEPELVPAVSAAARRVRGHVAPHAARPLHQPRRRDDLHHRRQTQGPGRGEGEVKQGAGLQG